MSEFQNHWIKMDKELEKISNSGSNTEMREKNFVTKYLRELGGKTISPKIMQDKLNDGRSVRIYMWMNSELGNVGLVTGRDTEPSLKYLIGESEGYDENDVDMIIPRRRQEPLISVSIPLQHPSHSSVANKSHTTSIKRRPNTVISKTRRTQKINNPPLINLFKKFKKDRRFHNPPRKKRRNPLKHNVGLGVFLPAIQESLAIGHFFEKPIVISKTSLSPTNLSVEWGSKSLSDKGYKLIIYYSLLKNGNELSLMYRLLTKDGTKVFETEAIVDGNDVANWDKAYETLYLSAHPLVMTEIVSYIKNPEDYQADEVEKMVAEPYVNEELMKQGEGLIQIEDKPEEIIVKEDDDPQLYEESIPLKSKEYINKETGEIVTQIPLMDIDKYEEYTGQSISKNKVDLVNPLSFEEQRTIMLFNRETLSTQVSKYLKKALKERLIRDCGKQIAKTIKITVKNFKTGSQAPALRVAGKAKTNMDNVRVIKALRTLGFQTTGFALHFKKDPSKNTDVVGSLEYDYHKWNTWYKNQLDDPPQMGLSDLMVYPAEFNVDTLETIDVDWKEAYTNYLNILSNKEKPIEEQMEDKETELGLGETIESPEPTFSLYDNVAVLQTDGEIDFGEITEVGSYDDETKIQKYKIKFTKGKLEGMTQTHDVPSDNYKIVLDDGTLKSKTIFSSPKEEEGFYDFLDSFTKPSEDGKTIKDMMLGSEESNVTDDGSFVKPSPPPVAEFEGSNKPLEVIEYPDPTSVDDLITIFQPATNKISNWEGYIEDIYDELITNSGSDVKAFVQNKIVLTNEQYDFLLNNLLDTYPNSMIDFEFAGGTASLSQVKFNDFNDFFGLSKEQQEDWKDKSYTVVTQIESENRQTVFADSQGFSYVRYLFFDKKPSQDWTPIKESKKIFPQSAIPISIQHFDKSKFPPSENNIFKAYRPVGSGLGSWKNYIKKPMQEFNVYIQAYVFLTNFQYDYLINHLNIDYPNSNLDFDFSPYGGTDTLFETDKDFNYLSEDEQKEYLANQYFNVVGFSSENRKTFYVDPQGYDYPKYIFFSDKPSSDWTPIADFSSVKKDVVKKPSNFPKPSLDKFYSKDQMIEFFGDDSSTYVLTLVIGDKNADFYYVAPKLVNLSVAKKSHSKNVFVIISKSGSKAEILKLVSVLEEFYKTQLLKKHVAPSVPQWEYKGKKLPFVDHTMKNYSTSQMLSILNGKAQTLNGQKKSDIQVLALVYDKDYQDISYVWLESGFKDNIIVSGVLLQYRDLYNQHSLATFVDTENRSSIYFLDDSRFRFLILGYTTKDAPKPNSFPLNIASILTQWVEQGLLSFRFGEKAKALYNTQKVQLDFAGATDFDELITASFNVDFDFILNSEAVEENIDLMAKKSFEKPQQVASQEQPEIELQSGDEYVEEILTKLEEFKEKKKEYIFSLSTLQSSKNGSVFYIPNANEYETQVAFKLDDELYIVDEDGFVLAESIDESLFNELGSEFILVDHKTRAELAEIALDADKGVELIAEVVPKGES